MITQTLKNQARARGLRLTVPKGAKRRVRKTEAVLRREIANHNTMVMANQMKQAKGVMTMCQALMNIRRASPPRAPVMFKAPPPPPPPPPPPMMFKAPPPKKAPSPPKKPPKLSMLNELKVTLNKKGLKRQFNKNAKVSTAS